jgi:hypothetical protein
MNLNNRFQLSKSSLAAPKYNSLFFYKLLMPFGTFFSCAMSAVCTHQFSAVFCFRRRVLFHLDFYPFLLVSDNNQKKCGCCQPVTNVFIDSKSKLLMFLPVWRCDILPLFGQKVPLNKDVVMKCMCGMCPVQAQSACSKPKLKMMMDMRASMGMKGSEMPAGSMSAVQSEMSEMKMPSPDQLPGPYCSISKAACNDLDMNKACICNTCQVYKEYKLASGKPVEHFCFNGKAT